MNSLLISLSVFACTFGAAVVGFFVRTFLPDHHLSADSKDVVKLAMGLVATMAALVLGLLTASAKTAFDTEDGQVKQATAKVVLVDRALARYGPESGDVRARLRSALEYRLRLTWPEAGSAPAQLDAPQTTAMFEGVVDGVRDLAPQNDVQRALQAQALQMLGDLAQTRWLVLESASGALSMPLLVVLVFWLAALFLGFGIFARPNGTVTAALIVCALSVSGSIYLILEMSRPFEGLIKVSSAPLVYALAHMGQ